MTFYELIDDLDKYFSYGKGMFKKYATTIKAEKNLLRNYVFISRDISPDFGLFHDETKVVIGFAEPSVVFNRGFNVEKLFQKKDAKTYNGKMRIQFTDDNNVNEKIKYCCKNGYHYIYVWDVKTKKMIIENEYMGDSVTI